MAPDAGQSSMQQRAHLKSSCAACVALLTPSHVQLADDPSKNATQLNHGQREFFKHVVSTAAAGAVGECSYVDSCAALLVHCCHSKACSAIGEKLLLYSEGGEQ
jgi:hypothetical protein